MKQLKHVFTVLLLLCTTVASAHDFEIDGIYYKGTNIANTVEVTYKGEFSGNKDYAGNVNVPDHIVCDNGVTYQVVGIGDYAFMGCTDLVGITIPNSVTSIGEGAFYGCTSLKDVIIPENVTSIGYGAFSLCSGLKTVTVGDGVESIGCWAFSGCYNLSEFVFGSSVSSIAEEAFSDCIKMTKITSRALMPPVCGEQALDDIDKWVCVLYAPERNNELYQEAEQWKEFLFKEKLVTTDKYATYVIDGEEYKTLLLTPGKRIVVPSVANKDGQEFKGWEIEDPIMSDNDIVINGSFKSDEN